MRLVVEITEGDIGCYEDNFLRWPIDQAVERVVQTWCEEAAPHVDNPDLNIDVCEDSFVVTRAETSRRYPLPEIAVEDIRHTKKVKAKIQQLEEEIQSLKETLTPYTFTVEVDDELFVIAPTV